MAGRGLEEATRVEANQQKQPLLAAAFPHIRQKVFITEGDLWSNLRAALGEHKIDLVVTAKAIVDRVAEPLKEFCV